MNNFCKNCEHKKIPSSLKKIFNKYGSKIFIDECPLNDPLVVGCTTKLLQVEWIMFLVQANKMNLLNKEELSEVAKHFNARSGDSETVKILS